MIPPTIVGFNSSVRTPGFYGQTNYGAGAVSAASIPLILLLCGNMIAAGTATANSSILSVTTPAQADLYFGAGSELARMCKAALLISGVTIFAAPILEAGGAAAATLTITIVNAATATGTYAIRLDGKTYNIGITSGDAIATQATNIAAAFTADSNASVTASPSAGVVTLSMKSKGIRGNQRIVFQDITQLNGSASTYTLAGGTGVTGGGVPFSGGTGTDSAATMISLLGGQQYDRIVCSQNDSTNLGLWSTFLNTMAGSTINNMDHFIFGTNGTRSAAQTLSTTLNQQRMQQLLYLNSETSPQEFCAYWGAYRCTIEQSDPAASAQYDGFSLAAICAPQSQRADWPTSAQLNTSINNGVTEISTDSTGVNPLVSRSVTTHTLTGAAADYRTLDTSQAYCPDFIRRDIGLLWSTSIKPQNPRVSDDPPQGVKELPAGITTPTTWNRAVLKKLRDYERGALASGSAPTAQTVPPIIINVSLNLPTSVFSQAQQCILSNIPVSVAPAQHQIGVVISQVG